MRNYSFIKTIINYLSGPASLHYVMPILMVYLVAGTIAQKYIGLYEATRMFFSSIILWLGPVPLPGMPLWIGLIFINLAVKLFFKSPWIKKNAGIIIIHIGVMLLLFGGLFTALASNEGYVDLVRGESKNYVSDYHTREFVLLNEHKQEIKAFSHQTLSKGEIIRLPNVPLSIEIMETCRNCRIKWRIADKSLYYGMAKHMELYSGPLEKENEENLAGLTFKVNEGIYLVLENVRRQPEILIEGKKYYFTLRRERRLLPFSITLLEFTRDMHPGTTLASAYQSRVLINDNGAKWESLIRMNEPLRYKGYTFFQSSFIETPEGDISVLAAVWNVGRAFPYIAGLTMCFGMIIHLFARRKTKQNGRA